MTDAYFWIINSKKSLNALKKSISGTAIRVIDGFKRRSGEYWFLVLSEEKPNLPGISSRATIMEELI